MTTKDEIKFILRKVFDDGELNERTGGASPALILNLDKLVWNYLKDIATAKGLDRQGRFNALTKTNETYTCVRDALDILTTVAIHKNYLTIKASEILCDSYQECLNDFLMTLDD